MTDLPPGAKVIAPPKLDDDDYWLDELPISLHDYIAQKGKQVTEQTELHFPLPVRGELESLAGIERFVNLNSIFFDGYNHEVSLLNHSFLRTHINDMTFVFEPRKHVDVWFLSEYEKLKSLSLTGDGPEQWTCNFGFLKSPNLIRSVKKLVLGSVGSTNFEYISQLENLEQLVIHYCTTADDFSALESEKLKRNLKKIIITNAPKLTDLNFFDGYSKLQRLRVSECPNLTDFSALKNKKLEQTVTDLSLFGTSFSELELLKNYQKIEKMDLTRTHVRDISELINYPFVENGALKKLYLPDELDLMLVKDGKLINQETIAELKRRGVQVNIKINFTPPERLQGKVYVLCGPSGAGKTTLITQLTNVEGITQLAKTSTRPKRSQQETEHKLQTLSVPDFISDLNEGKINAGHKFYGQYYGVRMTDLADAYLSKQTYFLDFVEPEAAFKLRESNKGFVEVILLLPFANLIEQGLQQRLESLNYSLTDVTGFLEQVNLMKSVEANIVNTEERIRNIAEEYKRISAYAPYADHVLSGLDYKENMKRVIKIMSKQ